MENFRYLARGFSNQEIANKLEISVTTIATHVRNLLSKMYLANRN
jgi:NarL family two-component system response regulator LiaR